MIACVELFMPSARIPNNEQKRLDALDSLCILSLPLNDRFDRITRTACRMFNAPISYISLIDRDTQWLKSTQGLEITTTERSTSICAHTLLVDEYIVCEDLSKDERFKDNPFVVSGIKLRFYAGFTLKSRGQNIGTLCIADDQPREFNHADIAAMRDLAFWAQTEIDLAQMSEIQTQLVTELDQAQQEAKTDDLTKLWNQGAIKDVLQRAHQRHLITHHPYSIMMIDIDNFKGINDTYGHLFGDQVLKKIATELKASLRPSDIAGRYGGDEFLIILEKCPYQHAVELSKRVLQHSHQVIATNKGEKIKVTISIGFASSDTISMDAPDVLLEHADKSLYAAKESGRNCAKG